MKSALGNVGHCVQDLALLLARWNPSWNHIAEWADSKFVLPKMSQPDRVVPSKIQHDEAQHDEAQHDETQHDETQSKIIHKTNGEQGGAVQPATHGEC